MKLIEELKNKYNSISIIGLAKNVGKTVTLNYLIEEAYDSGVVLGLTSTGRDGERLDIVTDTEKPAIYVAEGTLIATSKSMLEAGDAGLEILESTNCTSPLGNIVICRIKEEGNIQLAGPSTVADIKTIKNKLMSYGAKLIIIDGAIDRKAVSSPEITDACILSTGAVLSRDIKKVVLETVYYVNVLTLPYVNDKNIEKIRNELDKTCIINDKYEIAYPEIKTGLGRGKTITTMMDESTKYIYISGALTTSMLKDLSSSKNKIPIIIEDGTRIFSDYHSYKEVLKRGLKIYVLSPIKIEAISVNPVSPLGYSFEREELLKLLRLSIKDIRIFDVFGGE
jgi:hypothetical protein